MFQFFAKLHQPHQYVRHPLVLHTHQHGIVTPARCDAGDDTLRLRVPQYPVLSVTASDAAQLDSPHRNIEAVIDQQRRIDDSRAGFDLPCDFRRLSSLLPRPKHSDRNRSRLPWRSLHRRFEPDTVRRPDRTSLPAKSGCHPWHSSKRSVPQKSARDRLAFCRPLTAGRLRQRAP